MKKKIPALLILLGVLLASILIGCGSSTNNYQFKSQELDKYVIVYQQSNPDYFDLALKLSDTLLSKYGVNLQILPDAAASPVYHEILLGDTNRRDTQSRVMEYSVTVENGKFQINTGGTLSAEKAIAYLCEQVFTGKELTLESGQYYRKSLLTKAHPISEGSDARIMSANILADTFADGSYQDAFYRAEIFAGMLVAYTPDVVGLQEADESWDVALDYYLEKLKSAHNLSYSRYMDTCKDQVNYTSLLYRDDKFQAQYGEIAPFSWWTDPAFHHSYHMRNISWGCFTSLENAGDKFIVANTHWSYRTEHANGNTYLSGSASPVATNQLREQCRDETNMLMGNLQRTNPNTPVFLTGDFNTSLSFFTQSGWTPSGYSILSEEASACGVALNNVPESGHYDHLFGTGSYRINQYAFFSGSDYMDLLTDHPFAYADVAFN